VIVVLASDKYASAGDLLGVIVAGTLLWALLPIYASGLYIAKKTQIISLTVLVCVLLDVGLNLVFIRWWGLRGRVYAALLTCIFACRLSELSLQALSEGHNPWQNDRSRSHRFSGLVGGRRAAARCQPFPRRRIKDAILGLTFHRRVCCSMEKYAAWSLAAVVSR
jgi:hypothetical protein